MPDKEQAEWVPCKEYPHNEWYKECSSCGCERDIFSISKYCPNCGSRMKPVKLKKEVTQP
jgi:uncharacterized OB-fold protein